MARLKGSGKTPGSGRRRGSKNKATVELQEAAKRYSKTALQTLSTIARKGQSESARVSAACALLDRAYGKPPVQPVAGDLDELPLAAVVNITIAGATSEDPDAP